MIISAYDMLKWLIVLTKYIIFVLWPRKKKFKVLHARNDIIISLIGLENSEPLKHSMMTINWNIVSVSVKLDNHISVKTCVSDVVTSTCINKM